jgi:hypothetical protein
MTREDTASRKWYERVTSAQHPLNTRPAHWWVPTGGGGDSQALSTGGDFPAPAGNRNGAKDLRSGSRTSMDATDAQARP